MFNNISQTHIHIKKYINDRLLTQNDIYNVHEINLYIKINKKLEFRLNFVVKCFFFKLNL